MTTLAVVIFVAGTAWALAGTVWAGRMEDALERATAEADAELEAALDERDLEWVRIIARRDVAILAAVERWPDKTRPVEEFADPAQAAEYAAETWRLKGHL